MVADMDVQANREAAEHANHGKQIVGRVDLGKMGGASCRSTVCRRSSSDQGLFRPCSSLKLSKLIVIIIQLLFLSSFCRGDVLGHLFGHGWSWSPTPAAERGQRRLILSSIAAASIPNFCTGVYVVTGNETCASLRKATNLTQAQIYEINPELNCKALFAGQSICVKGISSHCARTISVTKGPTNATCASLQAGSLSTEGFFILNPGISCPEAPGNQNSWPASQVVCVVPGLGNIFSEYVGASGLPITFSELEPLYKRYPGILKYVILSSAIDIDASGARTNGVFHPYWNPSLTPSAAKSFKAANPDVVLLMSLGGPSRYVNSTVFWQDPPSNSQWIASAVASLTAIAQQYSIDGIDIYYESFPQASPNFQFCIGTLITQLKASNTVGLATIAPPAAALQQYSQLMSAFSNQIDYVNFQFYTYQLPTVASYVSKFDQIAGTFVPWKLLASSQIKGKNSITGAAFLQALQTIVAARGLPGVMLYDADNSVGNRFQDENLVLSLLNGTQSPANGTNSTTPAPSPGPSSRPAPGPFSLAPAPIPGAPHSSLTPAPAPAPGSIHGGPALSPGAPQSSLAPGSIHGGPALSPGAPQSSLAPGSIHGGPALSPRAPQSSLAPGSIHGGPAHSPGAPQSSRAPGGPAPGTSLPPFSAGAPKAAPRSGPAPGPTKGQPKSSSGSLAPAPSPNSAPKYMLRSGWSSQGFRLFAAIVVLRLIL